MGWIGFICFGIFLYGIIGILLNIEENTKRRD